MTLDGIEELLKKNYWTNQNGTINRRYNDNKVNLVRYADDITVTAMFQFSTKIKKLLDMCYQEVIEK